MKLCELSEYYTKSAELFERRIRELRERAGALEEGPEKRRFQERIKKLGYIRRELREIAVLTRRYYERGYYRSEKYTV